MTTVSYRDGVMAADSRCSDEYGMHLTHCQKIYRLSSGALLGTAGDDDARSLMDLLAKAKTPKQLPSRAELAETKTDFKGILVFPKGDVYLVGVDYTEHNSEGEWTGYISEIRDRMCAVGSGQQFAYGAMEAGKSAADAVRIACKRDTNSALPVQMADLKAPAKRRER